jgi:hypothetical protein
LAKLKLGVAIGDYDRIRPLTDGTVQIDGVDPQYSLLDRGHPDVGYLFADPQAEATAWFRRTGLFSIKHLIDVRKELAERHPWLPAAITRAFTKANGGRARQARRHVGDRSRAIHRCTIKGNGNRGGERIDHTPGQLAYSRVDTQVGPGRPTTAWDANQCH